MFQRIDVLSKDFENIVELELGAPWPIPPVQATATLAHKFEVLGILACALTYYTPQICVCFLPIICDSYATICYRFVEDPNCI